MYSFIAKNLLYYPIQFFRGEKVGQYSIEVRAFNLLDREEMEKIQWVKLKQLLNFVYEHNPYYHDLFDHNQIHPDQIRSLEEYRRVPLLAKDIIQENSARLLSEGSFRLDHRKTSGSTGRPLKFAKDRLSLAYMNAVMHNAYSWHGIEVGDKSCRVWAIPKDSKKQFSIFMRDHLQNRRRLNSFDVSDESSRKFFQAMLKFRPKFMMGVPSYITDFAKRLQNASLNPADIGLKVIISTGEILYPAQKQLMEEAFSCRIANEYGTSECGIIAFACPEGRMHLMNHNLLVENIDPETGAHVPAGNPGEIVITELHSYYMPFIRYRLGDTLQISKSDCDCGRQSPCLDYVEGRLEDMIITPSGKKVAGGVLYYTLTEGIHQFKAYQRAVNRLEIIIIKEPGFSETRLIEIEKQLHEYLGEEMKIDFRFVDHIPADRSGKLRYFVPEFDPDYITPPPDTPNHQ